MGRGFKSPLRFWLATFCVALSVVFAGTSAASVVDRIQHALYAPHEHAGQLQANLADDDHRQHADGGDHDDLDQAPIDHQPGPGHHHIDGPTGFISRMDNTVASVSTADALAPVPAVTGVAEIWPGGLERPPKALAIHV